MKNIVAAIAALVLMVVNASAEDVVVSSKIDTEGGVLGNMILEVLAANDIPVVAKVQLGGTPIVREAIAAGEIDIYPEYTGNAAFFFNEADSDVWKDPEAGYKRAAELDLQANNIVWLTPAPANNTWAIAIRKEIAEANNLSTMSDLGKFISGGGDIKLAGSSEFVNSAAALPAFQETYGFKLSSEQLVILSGGDTAATIAAAARQTSGVNAAMVYGTDGGIEPSGLVVMEDDLNVQPVYRPAPIVRREVLERYPSIVKVLEPVFAKLDLETLQKLNGRVQVGGEAAKSVAVDYLKSEGLIK